MNPILDKYLASCYNESTKKGKQGQFTVKIVFATSELTKDIIESATETSTMSKKQKIVPFETRTEASYWGGTGVIAEDRTGGWWALGFVSTPSGIETYCVGKPAEPISGGPWRCVVDGFPDTLLHRHFVGRNWETGNGYEIYREVE